MCIWVKKDERGIVESNMVKSYPQEVTMEMRNWSSPAAGRDDEGEVGRYVDNFIYGYDSVLWLQMAC